MNAEARKTPSRLAIRREWADWLVEVGKFDSVGEVFECGDVCWACGFETHVLDRCHIEARSEGGADSVGNLHLLCRVCHRDSEMLDGDAYYEWFANRSIFDRAVFTYMRAGGSALSLVGMAA